MFNSFKELAEDTRAKVAEANVSARFVFWMFQRTARVLEGLFPTGTVFDLTIAEEWLASLKKEAVTDSKMSCYHATRRAVYLMWDNLNGRFDATRVYGTRTRRKPSSEALLRIGERYVSWMRSELYADATIDFRLRCADNLMIYMESSGVFDVGNLTPSFVQGYCCSPRFLEREPSGVNAEQTRLRLFLAWLCDEGLCRNRLVQFAVPLRAMARKRETTILTEEEKAAALDYYERFPANLKNRAAYMLALKCGLRSSDIAELEFRNLDFRKHRIAIKQRKTGVTLTLPMAPEVENALIDYILGERREPNDQVSKVFVTSRGPIKALTRNGFSPKPRYLAKGLSPAQLGMHIMRRTFASDLLKAMVATPVISAALGHTDKDTVNAYLSTDEGKMRRCGIEITQLPRLDLEGEKR